MKIGDTSALQPCKLQQIRSEKNISQRELAEAIGINTKRRSRCSCQASYHRREVCDPFGANGTENFA